MKSENPPNFIYDIIDADLKSNKYADWDFYNVLDDHLKFKVGDDELIDKTYFNSNNPIFIKVTEGNYKIMPNFCSGKNTEIKE